MRDNKAVLFYSMFLMILAVFAGLGSANILAGSVPDSMNTNPVADCDIGGWDAIVDAGVCIAGNITFLTQFIGFSSSIDWLSSIVFVPFSLLIAFIVLKIVNPLG